MNLNLKGTRALVCGSTQGIGKATALELALLGVSVTLLARNREKLEAVLGELTNDQGQDHDYMVADFSFPDQVRQTLATYKRRDTITILVNNTGGPNPGPAATASIDEFVAAFNNHLLCNQVLVQGVVDAMKQKRFGRIVNIISTSVKIPINGLGVSNTIRGAVANWSKTLANELGSFGITVNNVLPGSTMTGRLQTVMKGKAQATGKSVADVEAEMIREIPAGRIAEPHEVAAAVAFLATPAAAYINGINLTVDGGRTGCL
jgi:3-oxoacyl-[acyl-carrier protein] reductase